MGWEKPACWGEATLNTCSIESKDNKQNSFRCQEELFESRRNDDAVTGKLSSAVEISILDKKNKKHP